MYAQFDYWKDACTICSLTCFGGMTAPDLGESRALGSVSATSCCSSPLQKVGIYSYVFRVHFVCLFSMEVHKCGPSSILCCTEATISCTWKHILYSLDGVAFGSVVFSEFFLNASDFDSRSMLGYQVQEGYCRPVSGFR